MYLSIDRSIDLSIYLSYSSLYLPIDLSIYLTIYLSSYPIPILSYPILSVLSTLSILSYVYLSCLSMFPMFESIHLSTYLSIRLLIYLSSESAAPANKSVPDLAKVLCLSRNQIAKVLCLPLNLYFRLPKAFVPMGPAPGPEPTKNRRRTRGGCIPEHAKHAQGAHFEHFLSPTAACHAI